MEEVDYQDEHAGAFAHSLCLLLRYLYPGVQVRYLLLTSEHTHRKGEPTKNLVHAYVAFAQFLFDSDGISELQDARDRLEFWDEMEQEAIASTHRRRGETFTTDIQLEQEIPAEWIKPMNKEQLKRDVVNFLASEDIRPLLPERKTNSQPRN